MEWFISKNYSFFPWCLIGYRQNTFVFSASKVHRVLFNDICRRQIVCSQPLKVHSSPISNDDTRPFCLKNTNTNTKVKRSDQEFGQLASLGIKNLLLRGTQLKVMQNMSFVCRLYSSKFGFDYKEIHLSFILNEMKFVSKSILVQNVSPSYCFLLQNTKFIFGCAVYTGRDTKMSQVNTINDKQL